MRKGLEQSAGSLENICIVMCLNLRKLSECLEYLTSLRKLEIYYCTNLLSLPDGMECLNSLQSLTISGCPELSASCMSSTGKDFYKVEYINEVVTDSERRLIILFPFCFSLLGGFLKTLCFSLILQDLKHLCCFISLFSFCPPVCVSSFDANPSLANIIGHDQHSRTTCCISPSRRKNYPFKYLTHVF